MKRMLAALLLTCAVCLSACGSTAEPAQNAAPLLSEAEQIQLLEENRALWEYTESYESPWYYTFTDLDRNGRLEVISASMQGSGLYTYARYFEVRADGTGLDCCWHENDELEGPEDWPEIVQDSLPCWFDASSGRYYYACEGITRDGYAHQYYTWQVLSLKDGVAEWETVACKDVNWDQDGNPSVSCQDAQGNVISEQEYDSAVGRRFAGMEKSALSLVWTEVDIPLEEADDSGSSWLDGA